MKTIAIVLALFPSVALAAHVIPVKTETTRNNGLEVTSFDSTKTIPNGAGKSVSVFNTSWNVKIPKESSLSKATEVKMDVVLDTNQGPITKTFGLVRFGDTFSSSASNGAGMKLVESPSDKPLEVYGRRVFVRGVNQFQGQEYTDYGRGIQVAKP